MRETTDENAYWFADQGCRVNTSGRGARRWFVAIATAPPQASSCRSIAYRSARYRLSSSVASTRFSPTGFFESPSNKLEMKKKSGFGRGELTLGFGSARR